MSEMKIQTIKTIINSVCETIVIFEKLTGLTFDVKNETFLRIAAGIEQVKILTKKIKLDQKYKIESTRAANLVFNEIDALKIKHKINICHECLNYESCKINGVLSNDPDCLDFTSKTIKKPIINRN